VKKSTKIIAKPIFFDKSNAQQNPWNNVAQKRVAICFCNKKTCPIAQWAKNSPKPVTLVSLNRDQCPMLNSVLGKG
jgi:hypothetical protein